MIFQPPEGISNGKGVIWVVSAGWTSDYNWIPMFRGLVKPISDKGYTDLLRDAWFPTQVHCT